ncbi:MAG: PSD1 domain-containing protein [Bryobacteraceae bacterium]|nr:PSD1 domain-containing protein [Bryobacteraceae bacterium]
MHKSAAALLTLAFAALPALSADLFDRVQPLLKRSCLGCHNEKLKQGGLDLSTRDALLRGSEHGPVVVPGRPEESQLYKLVAHVTEPGMPFKSAKLPAEDVDLFAEWIRQGAPYGEPVADAEGVNFETARSHWAYRPPASPPIPATAGAPPDSNPIDSFLVAERDKRGLAPLPEADRRVLLRRVYLDLIGLPPSPEETAAYLADKSPAAYENVVDKLLASPRHGERWGRHWLDIWRYSDWYGWRKQNQVRYSARHIWRWRDWTIESLNANKPYDRMILEMLAGDELAPTDPDTVRATGYLARNWYMFNRNVWLQDAVEYTSTAFLGVTMKCARCHSHKYDPIPQSDYYRLRAYFEPHEVRTDRVPGEADTMKAGLARIYDAHEDKPTYRFIRGNENSPDTSLALHPGIPRLFGKPDPKVEPVLLPIEAYFPDGRAFVPPDLLAEARAAIEKAEADLAKAKETPEPEPVVAAAAIRLEAARAALPALEARIKADQAAMASPVPDNAEQLAEEARKLERQANFIKAEADLILGRYEFDLAKTDEKKRGAALARLEAAANALKEPAEGYTPIGPKYPASSTGRRLALARWIASKDNPLTARVAINHIWLRHFGKPLVPTVFNFGLSGKPPSHPELLDWLASEFMDRDWDMKAIHRLIVTSRAYRMRSSPQAPDPPQSKIDPDNVYLWRMNVRRMEAETVRDSVLALAGKLDSTMGGPEIDESKGNAIWRRSVYFRHAPDLQMDMLKVFDLASPNECFERGESIVPQQALALANGPLSLSMARVIAAQLAPSPDDAFISAAFDRVLGRAPGPVELRESLAYLREQAELYREPARLTPFRTGPEAAVKPSTDPAQRARESLVHVLLNHNDFVAIR